jgi:hypothetical protein
VGAADHSGFTLEGGLAGSARYSHGDVERVERYRRDNYGPYAYKLYLRGGPLTNRESMVSQEDWDMIAVPAVTHLLPIVESRAGEVEAEHRIAGKDVKMVRGIVEQWLLAQKAKIDRSEPGRLYAVHGSIARNTWGPKGKKYLTLDFVPSPDGGTLLKVRIGMALSEQMAVEQYGWSDKVFAAWERFLDPLWDRLGAPRAQIAPRMTRFEAEMLVSQGKFFGVGGFLVCLAMFGVLAIVGMLFGPAPGLRWVGQIVGAVAFTAGMGAVAGFFRYRAGKRALKEIGG